MMDERSPETAKRRYRWPWFLLAGVTLFFLASMMWMLFAVERVKRNKASTLELTNSHTSPEPAKR